MKRCFLFAAFLLVFSYITVKAQTPELKEAFVEADSYFLFEEYNEALPLFNRIHRADPTNNNVNYKIGICLLNDPYQKDKSIRYLEEASKDINPKYKENNFKETQAPPEAFFYLGHAYLVNNELDKAIENYNHFLGILDEEVYNVDLVEEQIRICERAKDLRTKPVDFDNENLGEPLNDRFSANNPIVSGNGKYLVFVSKRQFYDATFFSEKVDGIWQGPRNIIPELGVDGDVYPTSLSWDGQTMIIYRNDEFIGNLYMSRNVDGRWTKMVKLGPNINTKYWESHGTLSRDGKTLYFTSNRKGGYGGLDIFKSRMQEDGTWGIPENLGETVNSPYNDDTPFLTENQQTLYFSSQGHYNMGGYDIFYSIHDSEGEWDIPINIGYPINTTDNDLFFFPINNGLNAYYSQYQDDGFGRHDLYYMTLYSEYNPRLYLITGVVSGANDSISEDDEVTIYLIDRLSRDTTNITKPDPETNTFEIRAPKGDYDLLMRSMTFDDLVKRIRIDDNTDKKNGISLTRDDLVLETKKYVPRVYTGDDSKIELQDSAIVARAGEKMNIPLNVEEGSMLIVTHYVDGMIVSVDTIYTDSDSLDYEIDPLVGSNHVVFTMIEENGDTSTSEMTFNVSPAELPKTDETILADEGEGRDDLSPEDSAFSIFLNEIEGLSDNLSGDLKELLDPDKLKEAGVRSKEDLYHYLELEGVENSKVQELKAIDLADNDAATLHEMLLKQSDGELKVYLENLDLEKEGITSAAELIEHLRKAAENEEFKDTDIDDAILKLNQPEQSAEQTLNSLLSSSDGNLKEYLKTLDLDALGIESSAELIEYLRDAAEENNFTVADIDNALLDTRQPTPGAEQTLSSLLVNSDGNFNEYLKSLDLDALGIKTSAELIEHLRAAAGTNGFTDSDIDAALLDTNKPDPSSDQALKLLIYSSEGELKEYLKGLDLNKEGINTREKLLIHLLEKSGEDFSPELLIPVLSHQADDKPLKNFVEYALDNSPKSFRKLLKKIDLEKEGIGSVSELITYLEENAEELGITEEELQQVLAELLSGYVKETLIGSDQQAIQEKGISSGLKIIGSLLFTGILFIIIFFLSKRKEDEDER